MLPPHHRLSDHVAAHRCHMPGTCSRDLDPDRGRDGPFGRRADRRHERRSKPIRCSTPTCKRSPARLEASRRAKTSPTTSRSSRTPKSTRLRRSAATSISMKGLIDFVQSDDELAGVIGHETGHIERRHVLTSQSKLEALNLLFGLASMLLAASSTISATCMEAGAYREDRACRRIAGRSHRLAIDVARGLRSRQHEDDDGALEACLKSEHSDMVTKYLRGPSRIPRRASRIWMGIPNSIRPRS